MAKNVDLNKLAKSSNGLVGAELEQLVREAASIILEKTVYDKKLQKNMQVPKDIVDSVKIGMESFEVALKIIKKGKIKEYQTLCEDPNWFFV